MVHGSISQRLCTKLALCCGSIHWLIFAIVVDGYCSQPKIQCSLGGPNLYANDSTWPRVAEKLSWFTRHCPMGFIYSILMWNLSSNIWAYVSDDFCEHWWLFYCHVGLFNSQILLHDLPIYLLQVVTSWCNSEYNGISITGNSVMSAANEQHELRPGGQ